jgi:hypothetical protein
VGIEDVWEDCGCLHHARGWELCDIRWWGEPDLVIGYVATFWEQACGTKRRERGDLQSGRHTGMDDEHGATITNTSHGK